MVGLPSRAEALRLSATMSAAAADSAADWGPFGHLAAGASVGARFVDAADGSSIEVLRGASGAGAGVGVGAGAGVVAAAVRRRVGALS